MGTQSQKKSSTGLKLVDLSPSEVRHLPKPREGFDDHAQSLIELYEANGQELYVKGLDAANMRAELAAYQSLQEAEDQARKQLARVQETRLLHGSTLWSEMLAVYARAQLVARTDASMKRAIAGFEQLLKAPPRKKPGTPPSTTPPTSGQA